MIRPTSSAQYEDALARRTPAPESVRAGVWSLPLPLPPWAGMESTLTTAYVGDDGRVGLVDPGWDTEANRARLESWLDDRGRGLHDVHAVIASHLHPDHTGLARWLHDTVGTRIVLHRNEAETLFSGGHHDPEDVVLDRWGVPAGARESVGPPPHSTFPDLPESAVDAVDDGELVDLAGTPLRVIHTPGHTSGSICLADDGRNLLHTGDHVLPIVRPGLAMGGGDPQDPIGDYLRSLDAIRGHADSEILPGHEYRFVGLETRLDELAEHHLRRNAEVAALLDEMTTPTIWRLAQRVGWTGGWDAVPPRLRRSALRQTEFHVRLLQRIDEVG